VKMFDAGKNRMIGLYRTVKNCDDMFSHFHLIPGRYGQTNGRTDGQNCYINIARQCAQLTLDKNNCKQFCAFHNRARFLAYKMV